MGKTGRIRIGIGGWVFEPWRDTFYPKGLPQKRELEWASRQLTSIEINGTYYGSQKPESFARWHDETPEHFVFSLKAPRFATNRKVLAESAASVERFFTSGVMELRDKLGPVNWQFLPTKQFDPEDFAAFLALLPASHEGRRLRHVVEVRHESFRDPAFVELARQHNVAIALSGDSEHPLIPDPTADFVYARIMGTAEDEPLGYARPALDRWAQRAKDWAAGKAGEGLEPIGPLTPEQPRDVFLYVISGFKPRNPQAALALIDRLE
ncbi:DUF72 domain-containing protein [Cereibacter changlensis]|uniref:DUF72 domain-containing protein n=1 Tax=Cereibacter changlensis TaxID=402884 RepID=UPI004034CFFB